MLHPQSHDEFKLNGKENPQKVSVLQIYVAKFWDPNMTWARDERKTYEISVCYHAYSLHVA